MMDEETFARLLDSLPADDAVLITDDLRVLSDLDRAHIDRFRPVWEKLAVPLRRQLITLLRQQADEHLELLFDRLFLFALADPDAEVRRLATDSLWESQDKQLIPIFLRMANSDPSIDVRIAAIQALGRFVSLDQAGKINATSLANIEDLLFQLLEQEASVGIRRACIEALGYSTRSEIEGLIQAAYASNDDGLRQSALLAMGRSANEIWEEAILAELNSHSPELRFEAARAAGELELRSAVLSLIELLEDVNDDVRKSAIWSLGQNGSTAARTALEALKGSLEGEAFAAQVEDALEHIAFLESTPNFLLFDFDDEDDLD
ncbi:MAG: hypothetical protein E4G99_06980 [Anaerolineales bacterium]|nr:MAG: hypothetical protein E4G99_06980 [Anaerolineales bacterium]